MKPVSAVEEPQDILKQHTLSEVRRVEVVVSRGTSRIFVVLLPTLEPVITSQITQLKVGNGECRNEKRLWNSISNQNGCEDMSVQEVLKEMSKPVEKQVNIAELKDGMEFEGLYRVKAKKFDRIKKGVNYGKTYAWLLLEDSTGTLPVFLFKTDSRFENSIWVGCVVEARGIFRMKDGKPNPQMSLVRAKPGSVVPGLDLGIDGIPAGRAMDALIERIVSEKKVEAGQEIPPYSTDMAATWKLVEHMKERRYSYLQLEMDSSEAKSRGLVYACRFYTCESDRDRKDDLAIAEDAALVICRAALKKVRYKPRRG